MGRPVYVWTRQCANTAWWDSGSAKKHLLLICHKQNQLSFSNYHGSVTTSALIYRTSESSSYQVGQNLYQSFSSADTNQAGLDAAIDATVQVNNSYCDRVKISWLVVYIFKSWCKYLYWWYIFRRVGIWSLIELRTGTMKWVTLIAATSIHLCECLLDNILFVLALSQYDQKKTQQSKSQVSKWPSNRPLHTGDDCFGAIFVRLFRSKLESVVTAVQVVKLW